MRQKVRPDEVKIPSGRIENNSCAALFAKNYCYIDFFRGIGGFLFPFFGLKNLVFLPFFHKKNSKTSSFCHSDCALSFRPTGEIALVALVCCSHYVICFACSLCLSLPLVEITNNPNKRNNTTPKSHYFQKKESLFLHFSP